MPHLLRSAERSARKAGIDEVDTVSPHTSHYTYATCLYQDTCKIRMVQKTLGHIDLSNTLKYARVADEEIEGTMEALLIDHGSRNRPLGVAPRLPELDANPSLPRLLQGWF